jgi:spermidine synthase
LENPDKKFDLLVMNTRMHWRDHASSLLSVEFLEMARRHLNPGGALFYNTTFSPRALLTGATVFPYALRIMGFVAVSDSPIAIDIERWKNVLLQYRLEGTPLLNLETPASQETLRKMLLVTQDIHPSAEWAGIEFADGIRRRYKGLSVITDDNMGDEWR